MYLNYLPLRFTSDYFKGGVLVFDGDPKERALSRLNCGIYAGRPGTPIFSTPREIRSPVFHGLRMRR